MTRFLRSVASTAVCIIALNSPRAHGVVLDTRFNPITGHIYHLLGQSTWTDAEAEAVSLGGNLVTVNNAEEDAWIGDTFLSEDPNRLFWIGLNDVGQEGVWQWTSGEPFSYANWQLGEPNNAGDFEDVVRKEFCCGHIGDWNDANALADSLHGIVEVNVPEPSSMALATVAMATFGLIRRRRAPVQLKTLYARIDSLTFVSVPEKPA